MSRDYHDEIGWGLHRMEDEEEGVVDLPVPQRKESHRSTVKQVSRFGGGEKIGEISRQPDFQKREKVTKEKGRGEAWYYSSATFTSGVYGSFVAAPHQPDPTYHLEQTKPLIASTLARKLNKQRNNYSHDFAPPKIYNA